MYQLRSRNQSSRRATVVIWGLDTRLHGNQEVIGLQEGGTQCFLCAVLSWRRPGPGQTPPRHRSVENTTEHILKVTTCEGALFPTGTVLLSLQRRPESTRLLAGAAPPADATITPQEVADFFYSIVSQFSFPIAISACGEGARACGPVKGSSPKRDKALIRP